MGYSIIVGEQLFKSCGSGLGSPYCILVCRAGVAACMPVSVAAGLTRIPSQRGWLGFIHHDQIKAWHPKCGLLPGLVQVWEGKHGCMCETGINHPNQVPNRLLRVAGSAGVVVQLKAGRDTHA